MPCYKTFISVGNAKQHFSRLLNSIESLLDVLPHPVLIQSGHTPVKSTLFDTVDFISMDVFTQHINAAEILILHAGAGSLLHAIRANKYPIVVPRRAEFNEHVNDHQVPFAKMLETEGRAIMVPDIKDLREAIDKVKKRKVASTERYQSRATEVISRVIADLCKEK